MANNPPNWECPICEIESNYQQLIDAKRVDCPRCGVYMLSGTGEKLLETRTPELRRLALERAQGAAQIGEPPVISSREIEGRFDSRDIA